MRDRRFCPAPAWGRAGSANTRCNSVPTDTSTSATVVEYSSRSSGQGFVADTGDVDVLTTAVKLTFDSVAGANGGILDAGAMSVVIGGDHSISYPVVRAFREPLHVVHFDAHIDYSPFQHKFTHTRTRTRSRHIRKLDHVQSLTQVGIRSLRNSKVAVDDSIGDGNRVLGMEEFAIQAPAGIAESLPKDAAVYVSIDIDVLDLSLVPRWSRPEPDEFLHADCAIRSLRSPSARRRSGSISSRSIPSSTSARASRHIWRRTR